MCNRNIKKRLSPRYGAKLSKIDALVYISWLVIAFLLGLSLGIIKMAIIYEPIIDQISQTTVSNYFIKKENKYFKPIEFNGFSIKSMPSNQEPTLKKEVQRGVASWYDYDLNGIEWSKYHHTCASRYFKRYSTVIVKNLSTGKEIECFVNDYIEHQDRVIDLSSFAFSQLADLKTGLIDVEIRAK